MRSVENSSKNEIIINKSRFISFLFKVSTEEEVKTILNDLRIKYKDASHYCYAYIIQNVKRFDDDGEPSGTAGIPILTVLEKNDLDFILCVVIRYFGGIKLGTGGLVRAYSKSCREVILKSSLIELIDGYNLIINFSYEQTNLIEKLIDGCQINNKIFDNTITFDIDISCIKFDSIKDTLNLQNMKYETKKTLFVKK